MGTFAALFTDREGTIPENKRKEFAERIEKIFQAGGMMEVERVQLCGKRISMIRKAKMSENGMDFYYNYFEDTSWENAGFSQEGCYVWSEKIGGRHFHQAVVAAYVLEELYTEGVSVAIVNGDLVTSWEYVGWINYLFDEKYHIKNFDPWKLFEVLHYLEQGGEKGNDWFDFGDKRYAFIGGCEIYAVLNGSEKAVAVYDTTEAGELENIAMRNMKRAVKHLNNYKNSGEKDEDKQLEILMETIYAFYEMDEEGIDSLCIEDENLESVLRNMYVSDAPAFIIKVISEMYNVDFWDLWTKIRNVVKRKMTSLYGNDGYYILPISTQRFFEQSSDDMILYWEEGCDLSFSEELLGWFASLKKQYAILLNTEFTIENPLKYILDLLEEVDENYYQIYTFSDFFEESLENLYDKRYQSVWKLFDKMIHDPELKRAGDIIFVPDGPGHENEGVHYWGEEPKRRLLRNWDVMEEDKKNNRARVSFRRYMALMANKELRDKVFGF